MKIKQKKIKVCGIKIYIVKNKKEIARVYLYILKNDLHKQPFGLMEDVFVSENFRKKGIGSKLIKKVIKKAKINNCYKLICTSRYSRPEIHKFYKKLGFKEHGSEFRVDFK